MQTIAGNLLMVIIQLLLAVWILSFLMNDQPIWFHAIGGLAVLLFIVRIVRGDD